MRMVTSWPFLFALIAARYGRDMTSESVIFQNPCVFLSAALYRLLAVSGAAGNVELCFTQPSEG
jgi:hypothetical protein